MKIPLAANKVLKFLAIAALGLFLLLAGFYFFWVSPRYTVPILTYHDFGSGSGITVSAENFAKQMRFLKNNHYKVISLDALVQGLKAKKNFSRNTVVITMDDGYKDNFIYAYPVLKKYAFPATIFLITDEIGKSAQFLGWEEVRAMSGDNISFGGHTLSHAYLPSLRDKGILQDEIAGSKAIIEKNTGIPADYFSYPRGGFTEEIKILVSRAGYKGACTTNRGSDTLNRSDFYELKRISVRNSDSSFILWAKVSGYYNLFRKKKQGD